MFCLSVVKVHVCLLLTSSYVVCLLSESTTQYSSEDAKVFPGFFGLVLVHHLDYAAATVYAKYCAFHDVTQMASINIGRRSVTSSFVYESFVV